MRPSGGENRTAPSARVRVPQSSRQKHVLVVEDDPPIRGMLVDLLQDAGYAVAHAQDVPEALEHLDAPTPDLIVLDLMLPGMTGLQFLDAHRQRLDESKVPVLILSAVHQHGEDRDQLGFAEWLTKPLDVDRFLETVERLAGTSHPAVS